MTLAQNITKVVVAGGGVTAWSAAAALKKHVPLLDVQVIQTSPCAAALADRMISTLPSIFGFHADLGLTDTDVISGAASAIRIGTMFEGWAEGQPDYVHAYGRSGRDVGVVPFHQLWNRHSTSGDLPPFDRFSAAAEAARSGKLSSDDGQAVGLQLTLGRYTEMMRAYALHLGARVRQGEIVSVDLQPDTGFIHALTLGGGERVSADLFVDCAGPKSLLQQRLDTRFIDWSDWLPCDRIALTEAEPEPATAPLDRVAALPFGWRWTASSPEAVLRGFVYASAYAEAREADQALSEAGDAVAFRQGRTSEFWHGNCVAIGDAAISVEPLEWTNLHLVHSQLDRLISMMPGQDCAAIETAEFNRQCGAEADRVRDFVCVHYVCARRPEPFWQAAALQSLPPSLQHSLTLFKERGRLPYYEEETFSRDSWLTVLFGQGVRPRRTDPMADLVSAQDSAQALAAMWQALQSDHWPGAGGPPELNPQGIR